jgi:SAM-dependent methyltransferase
MPRTEDLSDRPCPICFAGSAVALDAPTEVPVLMNRLCSTFADARAVRRGPLELLRCQNCGFTWNARFKADIISYDGAYENDQSHSEVFKNHVEDLIKEIIATPAPIDYLEIGCGQGRFITELARLAGPHLRSAEGFDPAWRGADTEGPYGSRIHKAYFGIETADCLKCTPNVVVTRHTIEHVPNPLMFLAAIREVLGPHARATIFVETPCVDWILRHDAMQDFFYEHCSLFTAESLFVALLSAGFVSPEVKHVFGGQYLWARAETSGSALTFAPPKHLDFAVAVDMRERFTKTWRARVTEAAEAGRVAIWGAGAKGVSFALLVDPDGMIFDHVVDINAEKQGLHLPGSALPVIPPAQSIALNTTTYFVMNPHYLHEIAGMVRHANRPPRLVPLTNEVFL